MPWLSEAMKDAISCEKPRGAANTLRSVDLRMGQPAGSDPGTALGAGRTGGTETSQYPEEEKERSIARVAASESAGAQTRPFEEGRGL